MKFLPLTLLVILAGTLLWVSSAQGPARAPVSLTRRLEIERENQPVTPTELIVTPTERVTAERSFQPRREALPTPKRVVVNDLLRQGQRQYIHRSFKQAQATAHLALEHDPNSVLAQDLLNAATKALDPHPRWFSRRSRTREYLYLSQYFAGNKKDENAALNKKLDRSYLDDHALTVAREDTVLNLLRVVDRATGIPIIVTTEGSKILRDRRSRLTLSKKPTVRYFLDRLRDEFPQIDWKVRAGVVVASSAAEFQQRSR